MSKLFALALGACILMGCGGSTATTSDDADSMVDPCAFLNIPNEEGGDPNRFSRSDLLPAPALSPSPIPGGWCCTASPVIATCFCADLPNLPDAGSVPACATTVVLESD